MSSHYPLLFSPIRLGPRQARNRVMRLATTCNLAERGQVGDRMLAFYRGIAAGGAGTIVTEALRVHPSARGGGSSIAMFSPDVVPGLRRLAEVVQTEGALLIAQLNHGGRQHHAHQIPTLWAPSDIACPHSGGVPHEMSGDEVRELIAGFVRAAVHAREAGLDGVEIHGAQGHLIQEFISPFSNQRNDEYGGSFENRLRFAREIIRGVREAVGRDFVIGFRQGVEEFTPGGLTLEDSKRVARELAADGLVDYLSLSQGNFNTIETHLPDRHEPLGVYLDLHRQIKAEVGDLPAVTSTRLQTPDHAEEILSRGDADLIGLCRALIVDPEWPAKAQSGRAAEIRRCIACNQCWGWITEGQPLGCVHNATLGNEHELGALVRAERSRRVVVVGGGPAGLEAARVAAERGHTVTLLEREDALGGKIRDAAAIPGHEEVGNVLRFLVPQVEKLGVAVRLGTEATAQTIAQERPDAVIVATGATPAAPSVPGDGSVPILPGLEPDDVARLSGERVVVMDEDGYYWAASTAELLARAGKQVTLVTRFFEVLRELPAVSRIATLRFLDRHGVELRPNMAVARVEGGSVVLSHYYSGREERVPDAAAVIWLGPQRANSQLADDLRALGVEGVHLVGDAFAPRRLANAIQEGHRAGRAV